MTFTDSAVVKQHGYRALQPDATMVNFAEMLLLFAKAIKSDKSAVYRAPGTRDGTMRDSSKG
jgi:hypothetical protein